MTSTQTDHPAPEIDNSLDDIFGSSPPEGIQAHHSGQHTQSQSQDHLSTDPSDLPALRRQHVTAGYRDGVSNSKGEHVQEGFDAGFPVGAQLGMRAGTILGILEGLARGLEERSGGSVVKKPARGSSAAGSTELRDGEVEESRQMNLYSQGSNLDLGQTPKMRDKETRNWLKLNWVGRETLLCLNGRSVLLCPGGRRIWRHWKRKMFRRETRARQVN